jgi:hypothetical protein
VSRTLRHAFEPILKAATFEAALLEPKDPAYIFLDCCSGIGVAI